MSTHLFRDLHRGPTPLLLPNAWDAGSARLIESLGASAIATTSAGLCWSLGYPDGNAIPAERVVAAARDIARVIRVPLSVDIEGGYASDPEVVGKLVGQIIEIGAAGINLEDGPDVPDILCRKIEAARRQAEERGVDLFINARTDVYLRAVATGGAAVEEVIRRAKQYCAAGCDGIFVPGLVDIEGMAEISAALDPVPLNIMLVPNLPPVSVLASKGVRRLSAGSALAQAAWGHTGRMVTRFLATGNGEEVFAISSTEYSVMNQLFSGFVP